MLHNLAEYASKNIYSVQLILLHRKIFYILNVKDGHFYVYITHSLKVLNIPMVGCVRSTEWSPDFTDLNPSDYKVLSRLEQLVYGNVREPFQSLGYYNELKL
jgi:hypothetical protein